jgi:quercetin 2,3-dioxygenase
VLLDGELVHYDSLGYESLLRPGGVNVMTSGAAIAHAERTPSRNSGRLSGVQLWVALPDHDRQMSAMFQHVDPVPVDEQQGGIVQVFAGSLSALASPAMHHSGIFGGDVQVHPGAALDVPLDVAHEYAALVLKGDCSLEGEPLQERVLYHLGANRSAGTCPAQPVMWPVAEPTDGSTSSTTPSALCSEEEPAKWDRMGPKWHFAS